ncbi:uncharacterized protein SCHCODRAFT_01140382 [Schizophyllum commune H4-8]|nr:uncharacterized protein SCHCODRAFT_01140382 [Schizophyllum commune H4-8]KAI5893263.1 hypothetical protein SCHCODRAFT_01140382 [Schizophyllum commune H4-8]
MFSHVSSCFTASTAHHTTNLPPDGTKLQRAIPPDETSTRMTLRRPRNALEARNPTLAKTNLLDLPFPIVDYLLVLLTLNFVAVLCPIAFLFLPILAISRPSTYVLLWHPYIYFACNIFYFLRIHVNLLTSTFVLFDCFARSGLFAIRKRGHPLSCGLSNSVGLVTLVLKQSSPSPSSGLSCRPQVHHHPSPPRPDDAAVIVRTDRVYRPPSFVYFYFYIYFYFCSSATYEYYAPDSADTPDAVDDARYPTDAYDARDPTDAADDARAT